DVNAIESATLGEYRTKAGHYGRKAKANNKEAVPALTPEQSSPSGKFIFS
ncbi:MAG TPA: type IV secretion protein Rhs, partial [Lachnospiraceae bacterium]|nr:type IV secretion protein Rhs [Lachnospiraceae bacterium]